MNCSEEELSLIQSIAKKIAPKYKFPGYDAEDIEQEAIIIAIKSLQFYKSDRGSLTTFIWVHLSRRLKNLRRDKYYRPLPSKCENPECSHATLCSICSQRLKRNNIKKNIAAPSDVSNLGAEPSYSEQNILDDRIEADEIRRIIDDKLPLDMRADYLKMLDEVYVPKARRLLIEKKIIEILEENYER